MRCSPYPAARLAQGLLCLGLAIVLAAQLSPAVPVAGAIAICGWGSAIWCDRRWMPAVLAVYFPLAGLAIAAQLHPAVHVDRQLASIDSLAAALLVVLLVRYGLARLFA